MNTLLKITKNTFLSPKNTLFSPNFTKTNPRTFFTIVGEFEGAVRLNFGKFGTVLQPGIRLRIPFYHSVMYLDKRDHVYDISKQSLVSRDNVSLSVDASVQYHITDPKKAIINVSDLRASVVDRCKMEIRNTLSSLDVNDILHLRKEISTDMLESLKSVEETWGVQFNYINLKDIEFDHTMTRAMATEAEAKRSARAKIINAEADVKTAEQYSEAAKKYAENPLSLRLREMQLWNNVSKNPNNTIYVVPSNIVDFFNSAQNSQTA